MTGTGDYGSDGGGKMKVRNSNSSHLAIFANVLHLLLFAVNGIALCHCLTKIFVSATVKVHH